MAVKIVGKKKDIDRYRKILHERGMNTKRVRNHAVYKDKPEGFRLCQGTFKMIKGKPYEEDDEDDKKGKDEEEDEAGQGEEGTTGEVAYDPKRRLIIGGMANANIVDRMDERVDPRGGNFENFMKNPVLLADHMYWSSAVIGAVEELSPEDTGTGFAAVVGDPTKGPLTTTQEEVRSLIAQQFIKTVSIGFIPHKIQAPTFNDKGDMVDPAVILEWELLELSVVAVPANPDATFEMKQFVERQLASNTTNRKRFNGLTKLLNKLKNDTSKLNNPAGKPSGETKKGLDSMDDEEIKELLEGIKVMSEGITALAQAQKSSNDMTVEMLEILKGTGEPDEEEEEEGKEGEEEEEGKEGEEEEEEDDDEKDSMKATLIKVVEDVTKLSALVVKLYEHTGLDSE